MDSRILLVTFICTLFTIGSSMPLVSGSGRVTLKSKYPLYRFYFPSTHAFLFATNASTDLLALEHNPFALEILWQWIPLPQYEAALFRNLASKQYLCFDNHGKAVAIANLNLKRCLLQIFLLKSPNRTTSNHSASGGNNESIPGDEQLVKASLNTAVTGGLLTFKIPSAVQLRSKLDHQFYVGFCHNGHTFTHENPHNEECPIVDLPIQWNVVDVCPPIPTHCQVPDCMSGEEVYGRSDACPTDCHLIIHCIAMSDAL
ncbi:hypothetical protein Aperf_G00000128446 [Anoplocephala perfoliata]